MTTRGGSGGRRAGRRPEPSGSDRTGTGEAAESDEAGGAEGGAVGPDRLPNMAVGSPNRRGSSGGLAPHERQDGIQEGGARPLRLTPADDHARQIDEGLGDLSGGLNLGDHLTVVRRRAEELWVEGQD